MKFVSEPKVYFCWPEFIIIWLFVLCFLFLLGGLSFPELGNSSVDDYNVIYKEAEAFILACYNMRHCTTITQARQELWKRKMSKCLVDHPPLCTLPPTKEELDQNSGRAHLQLAIWQSCTDPDPPQLKYEDHGWMTVEGSSKLKPVLLPKGTIIAPPQLLDLAKCNCKSLTRACTSTRCGCNEIGKPCTEFCACKAQSGCHNIHTHWMSLSDLPVVGAIKNVAYVWWELILMSPE